jgi:hypothetical protein
MRLASILALAALPLCSCATMFSGKTELVKFQASPARGTTVLVNGVEHPLETEHAIPKRITTVTFRNEELGERVVHLDRDLECNYVILDILVTGIVGPLVDGPTAAWYHLPDIVSYDFETGLARQHAKGKVERETFE